MDELTLLDSTLPPAAGPTADVAAAGRNALLHEARRPVPPPRRTTTRRVVLTGALAASLAGAFTVAQNVGGSSSPGVIPGAAVANAAELGSAAAAAAEREPWRTPRPDQWVYQRTRNAAGGFDMNRSWEGVDPAHTNDVSDWSRVDGKGIAYFDRNGKLQTVIDRPGDGVETSGGPMWSVQNYATLPTER